METSFFVKQSTIRKAGLGCFVRCTELSKSRNSKFDVQLGELLDVGVYAPLRDEDKKTTTIFNLKNFVHSYAPEEWVFGSADGNLDVRVVIDHFCFMQTHFFWFYIYYLFFFCLFVCFYLYFLRSMMARKGVDLEVLVFAVCRTVSEFSFY
jgi:4-amino-4-deoxy-L-arabinose transferase-like glycosyltransferase